jgi:hypothetical protein
MRKKRTSTLACQLILAFAILLLGVGNLSAQTPQACQTEQTTKITNPGWDHFKVGREMDIKITSRLEQGNHLWVLVRRADFDGVWWPQAEAWLVDEEKQEFKAHAVFGQEQDVGCDFDVAVIMVDEQENLKLKDYRIRAMKTTQWNPIEMPPTTSAPVIRKVKKASNTSNW